MSQILTWIEERTGLISAIRGFFAEEIPISAGWHQVLGSMALFCFLLQAVTGLLLAFNYAPTPTEAHASIRYIMNEVTAGALIRSLHHWGASGMIIVVVLHMAQVFLWGAYKKPREATWLVGLVLLLLTLGFGLTGYLLPWDAKAYWGTVVTAQITGKSPVIGAYLLRLMGAENGVGAITFARFYTLHTFLLPLVMLGGIGLHIMLVRRHGVAPAPGDDGTRKKPFFPSQVMKDTVAIFALFAALMFLAINLNAPLGRVADPTDTSYVPRPEWYFLFLFEALKIFEGPAELVGSHILPGLAMAALAVLPFLDRGITTRLRQRIPALCILLVAFGTWAGLTRSAVLSTPAKQRPFAERGGPQDWQELNASQLAGLDILRSENCLSCHAVAGTGGRGALDLSLVAERRDAKWIDEFIQNPSSMVPNKTPPAINEQERADLVALILRMDPLSAPGIMAAENDIAKGARIFQAQQCAECHQLRKEGGTFGPALDGLAERRDRKWIVEHFKDPQRLVPGSAMPAFDLPAKELDQLTTFLLEQ